MSLAKVMTALSRGAVHARSLRQNNFIRYTIWTPHVIYAVKQSRAWGGEEGAGGR